MPKVIPVIESEIIRGEGDGRQDPWRDVVQYYALDGEFLAERDPLSKRLPYNEMDLRMLLSISAHLNGSIVNAVDSEKAAIEINKLCVKLQDALERSQNS